MAFMPQDFKSASLSQPPGTEQVNFVSVLQGVDRTISSSKAIHIDFKNYRF